MFVHTTPSSRVSQALKDGTYRQVFDRARNLETLDLASALERVLAIADDDVVAYDALVVRWIAMAIEERQLSLHSVWWAASRFREHLVPYRDCSPALRRLVSQKTTVMRDGRVHAEEHNESLRRVDEALEKEDIDAGLRHAYQVPWLPLDRAIRLTLLAGKRKDERYEASARKLLVAVTSDVRPGFFQVKKLTDCLFYVNHDFYGPFARDGLEGAATQLARRERRLSIAFDGPEP